MDLDDAVARLATLTRILHDPEGSMLLDDLARSTLSLVPSALAVVVVFDDQPGRLATVSDRYDQADAAARSSLRLEFSDRRSSGGNQVHRLIFLAEAPQAFSGFTNLRLTAVPAGAHLADPPDDARRRLTGMVIDQDLDAGKSPRPAVPDQRRQPTGDVDRAVGFLIDRGHEPAEAIRLLEDRARLWTLTLDEAADRILRSLD